MKPFSRKMRQRAWTKIVVSLVIVAITIVFRSMRWPGSTILILLGLPIAILLIVVGAIGLLTRSYKDSSHTDSSLKVDYQVRYAFNRSMRSKRKLAWVHLVVGMACTFALIIAISIRSYKDYQWFGDSLYWPSLRSIIGVLLLMIKGITILLTCVKTIRISRQLEVAMRKNRQAEFEVAMKKWSQRCGIAALNLVLTGVVVMYLLYIELF